MSSLTVLASTGQEAEYKDSLSGRIPVEWEEVDYGSVVIVNMPAFTLDDDETYCPVVVRRRHMGVETRETKAGDKILVKKQYWVKPGTFLISKRQIFHGSCGLVPENIGDRAIISKEYLALEAMPRLDIRFLDYFSYTEAFHQQIIRTTYGVDVEKFVFKDKWWMKERMPLPPLPEQQKIATILSSVDDVIEKTQAQIDKLSDLKSGMMQELLTKGIGHTEFKDSPVGRIPVGWDVQTMRDVCSVRQGLQIPISQRHSKNGVNRYVYLTIRFINTGFDPAVAEYIEKPKSSVICTEDDIILARTGATGKVVTDIEGVFHNNFFMVDYVREKINKRYLVQYLNSPFIQNEIRNRAGTTTIPDLNHGDFYSMVMLVPSMDEQVRISDSLSSIDNSLSTKELKLSAIKNTKKALMQDLLTGKVRVSVN